LPANLRSNIPMVEQIDPELGELLATMSKTA
jgi:hypothetical protein